MRATLKREKTKQDMSFNRSGFHMIIKWKSLISLFLTLLLILTNPGLLSAGTINWTPEKQMTAGSQGNPGQGENMLENIPLCFIENRGQMDKQVFYYSEGGNQGLYFTSSGLTFTLATEEKRWAVKMNFVNANTVTPRGESLTPTRISYLKGQPKDWKTGLNTYSRVIYPDLWPGIDLVFKGDSKGLKYEFVVAPGADPKKVKLAWQGAESITINKQGEMQIKTPIGSFTDQAPIAWQVDGQNCQKVDAAFCNQGQEWGFKLGEYDPSREMIIDPAIIDYCGYIGGTKAEEGHGIAADSQGRAYIAGETSSSQGFPITGGLDNNYNGGDLDVFVARVAADGNSLEYCTYIGGSDKDECDAISVDSSCRACVVGYTKSAETQGFPVSIGPDLTYNGNGDAFVARLAPNGASLNYCGYVGGTNNDWGSAIAIDGTGRAYITGSTGSSQTQNFPVKGGPDLSYNGGDDDAFVARVASDGSSLNYCGYIGGSNRESGYGITIDDIGRVYVAGSTSSSETQGFPVTVGPDVSYNGGNYDAFIARVAVDGTSIDYCGYIGGSDYDACTAIAVDNNDRAYICGSTGSSETQGFPARVGPDITYNGSLSDGFVARVTANGSSLDYCGYIGGTNYEGVSDLAIDNEGRVYLAGYTASSEDQGFPISGGLDSTFNGNADAFVARIAADGNSMSYCGYIGGSNTDFGRSIALDGDGKIYVSGQTQSTETEGFPLEGGLDASQNGDFDVFVARIKLQQGADLEVKLENPPTELAFGEKANVTAIVSNKGEVQTGKAFLNFYIGSQLLSTKNVSKLKPGKSKKIKVKLKVPAVPGSSTLKAEIIPSGEDLNNTNNIIQKQVTITLPDLTIKSAAVKGTLVAGKSGTLIVKAANLTIATAGPTVIRIYRGKDGTALGQKKLSKLKKQEKDLSIKIKVPEDFQPGTEDLRIVIDADYQVAEENEGNNLLIFK
ncbi:MAG: SBBP repeat-containing protein [Chitinophagales bacterium]